MAALNYAQRRKIRDSILFWAILLPLAITVIVPLWYLTDMAFTPEQNQLSWPISWLPQSPTLANF
ncbi:MAG: carbohydrate ABC transporter permease, partial [Caldilineaceae bacterium]|nr:carbohydrate ABC transporter permease [Caldilineaceae bacterium]